MASSDDEDIGATTSMIDEIEEDDGSDDDLFDSVCAICDNGGDILCCEGRCMRSFHATVEAGSESMCESLCLSDELVEAIQNFFCENCQKKQHQCFSCGELGSSDKLSGAEVFPCVSATCGLFYHPHCVAKLLHRESAAEAEELRKKIAAGESFTCPIHKCIVCKQGENKLDPDLQFAVCRRCPKSYHRKCLPGKITFEDLEDEGILQRAWEGLIPNRILIYCLEHEIDDEIRTPIRNHIKFPDDGQNKKRQALELLLSKRKVLQKERTLASTDASRKRTLGKVQKGVDLSSITTVDDSSKNSVRKLTGSNYSKKQKVGDTTRKPLNNTGSTKVSKAFTDGNRFSLGNSVYNLISKGSKTKSRKDTPDSEYQQTLTNKPVAKEMRDSLSLDADAKQRILALVKNASSSITLEEIIDKHKVPTTHAYSSKYFVDRAITLGKVEGSVEALRAALQKLEQGCSIEDAKAVCEPGLLNQMIKWKNKLKVYLAPFLYGMRYTSFGRHFTKVDKLKEIVDVLHFYVQDGDMIVDFCCGANDFSCLMKKKPDETGTRCSYKNYDVLQAKNDFNFEKRDWMTVHPKELPTGSQLIMGLNPPFGVNATLAHKFINKALEFKPKLLILIAPRETHRLDRKDPPYDLIWEDDEFLAGKSFYLPGSVDVNDNQLEDWNVNPPPLFLWSHPDWTAKHKAIAQQLGHLSRVLEDSHLEDHCEKPVPDYPMEVHELNGQASMSIYDHPVQNKVHEQLQERGLSMFESHNEGFPCDNGEREVHENCIEGYRHFEPNVSGSHSHFQTGYGWSQVDDISRRYSFSNDEPYSGVIHGRSSVTSPGHGPDYHGYGSYVSGIEEIYARQPVIQQQVPLYGQQCPETFGQRSSYLTADDPGFLSSYGHLDSAVDPSYNGRMNTSVMHQYAPPEDVLNHTMMNNLGSELPTASRNGIPDPLASQTRYRIDSLGFAPGPHPFPKGKCMVARIPLPPNGPTAQNDVVLGSFFFCLFSVLREVKERESREKERKREARERERERRKTDGRHGR